jgi:hypothetical protein
MPEKSSGAPSFSRTAMSFIVPQKNNRRGLAFPQNTFPHSGLIIVVAMFLTGCQWVGFNNHVTPQVSGRVLDADTRCPLAGVKVLRVLHGQVENPPTPVHGAQLMQQGRPVTTDVRGEFVYPGKSYFTFLNEANWWTLTLSFQSAGYAAWQTNFSTADIKTNLPGSAPQVEAGDILLKPLPK